MKIKDSNLRKAVILAIGAGWNGPSWLKYSKNAKQRKHLLKTLDTFPTLEDWVYYDWLLDYGFWKCLGKGMGYYKKEKGSGYVLLKSPYGIALDKKIDWGKYQMLRYMEYISSHKEFDKFFLSLRWFKEITS